MKYLYYCNSTYQLLNVLNLHWQRSLYNYENIDNYSADLILLNAYDEAEEIYNLLKEKEIFNSIKIVERVRIKGKLHIFKSILDIVFPTRFLKKSYNFDIKNIKNNYDVISTPKFNRLVLALWQINKKAKMQIHEDGLGTYIIDFNDNIMSNTYKAIYHIFNHGKHLYEVNSIYVNKKELYLGNLPEKVKEIPKINDEIKNKLLSFFDKFSIPENDDKKLYWLSQIISKNDDSEIVEKLENSLLKRKESVIYCPHPRNRIDNKYNFDVTHEKQIWELKILNTNDINNKILISSHSTAMLSPYILFGMEPYLIFTYRMIENSIIPNKDKFDKLVNICKSKYMDKDKIMIPSSQKEYDEYLKVFFDKEI